MSKVGKRPLRTLTAQEKLAVVKRVSAGGESKASVARDIGVPESTLRGWCKNHLKIYNQVCAGPNEADDEFESKRAKYEEPYDLSVKDGIDALYSPPFEGDLVKEEAKLGPSPLNMCVAGATTSSKATTPVSGKESLKNRAELSKLSAELGLNRPEVFLNSFPASRYSWNEIALLWNTAYSQMLCQGKLRSPHQQKKYSDIAAPTTKSKNGSAETKRDTLLSNADHPTSFQESASYWLQQQAAMGLNASASSAIPSQVNLNAAIPSAKTTVLHAYEPAIAITSNHNGFPMNSLPTSSAVICHKQLSEVNVSQPIQTASNAKPILYKQLTKETLMKYDQNSENSTVKEDLSGNNVTKNRSVLDDIYLNNRIEETGNTATIKKAPVNRFEAMQHGEIFLNWLDSCSDPAVTAIQISSLRGLIKNLKSFQNRKNGLNKCDKTRKRK